MNNDPKLGSDDDFVASLLAAGRADVASAGARRRALAVATTALGASHSIAASAAPGSATPTLASGVTSSFSVALFKVAFVASVAVAPAASGPVASAPASPIAAKVSHAAPRPLGGSARGPAPVAPRVGEPRPQEERTARPTDDNGARAPVTVASTTVRRTPEAPGRDATPAHDTPATQGAASAVVNDPLLEEVARLEAARGALAAGDVQAASALVANADQQPGALEPEREILAIEILVRTGQIDAARTRAAAFPQRFGAGRLATHVARLVGEASR